MSHPPVAEFSDGPQKAARNGAGLNAPMRSACSGNIGDAAHPALSARVADQRSRFVTSATLISTFSPIALQGFERARVTSRSQAGRISVGTGRGCRGPNLSSLRIGTRRVHGNVGSRFGMRRVADGRVA